MQLLPITFETVNDAFLYIYVLHRYCICTFFICINILSQCSYLHLSLSWLSSFTNSSTHQYKSISALPTVTIYVRYTTILATLYMIVKILWVFMTSPISTFHISSKNAIHLSWISHRVYSWHGETFRFVCLICSWKLLLAFLSIAPCMSGNVFQENAKSLCHSPVNKIFAFPFAKRPKKFSLSVWVDNTCRWSTPLTSPPLLLRAPAVATRRRRGHLMCHI